MNGSVESAVTRTDVWTDAGNAYAADGCGCTIASIRIAIHRLHRIDESGKAEITDTQRGDHCRRLWMKDTLWNADRFDVIEHEHGRFSEPKVFDGLRDSTTFN